MTILYIFAEPETIYDCASFICFVQFVLCCNGFYKRGTHFVLNKRTRLYTLLFAGINFGGLMAAVYLKLNDPVVGEHIFNMDRLVMSIFCLEIVLSSIVFIVTVLSLQTAAKSHLGIYERIEVLDRRLVDEFGANLNYRKLKRKNIIILTILSIAYTTALNSAVIQLAFGDTLSVLFGAWFYLFITGGPHFTGYLHMNLAEILHIRFRLLQKIMNPEFLNYNFSTMKLREERLESCIEIVKELHFIVCDINQIFKYSLWLAMMHDFTLSTSELYIIFGRSLDDNSYTSNTLLVHIALCMLPPFYKTLVAPIYCERTIKEGHKCLHLMKKLDFWFPDSKAVAQMVSSMMRWRLQHKIQFTTGMNSVVNKSVISAFTSVVVNYLLILIQFHMTQKMGEQIEQHKVALQEWIGL